MWHKYIKVTERQAIALDKRAREAGFGDGRDLLAHVADCSVSALSRMDRVELAPVIDAAFNYAPSKTLAEQAQEIIDRAKKPSTLEKIIAACQERLAVLQSPMIDEDREARRAARLLTLQRIGERMIAEGQEPEAVKRFLSYVEFDGDAEAMATGREVLNHILEGKDHA
jgi:hypothetical protein